MTGSFRKILFTTSVLAAASFAAAGGARAQDYGPQYGPPPGYANGPSEQVEVIAPRFREDSQQKLNGPLEKLSLSTAVSYSDLDLRTRDGARELRRRVYEAARDVCAELADAYPVYQLNGTHCFKEAYDNSMVRANAAITSARVAWRLSYEADYDRY